jgi:lysophospholipase L1-like esterase
MHELDCHRALSDGRGDALDRAGAHVSHRERERFRLQWAMKRLIRSTLLENLGIVVAESTFLRIEEESDFNTYISALEGACLAVSEEPPLRFYPDAYFCIGDNPGQSILITLQEKTMSLLRRLSLLCALLMVCVAPVSAQGGFALKPGDRVVFYGDSITDQRLYTTFAETYVVTRFPRLNVTFVHSGWGGDRVTGGGGGPIDLRLKRDVIAYRPTVMTIMLGMNDGSYRPFDQAIYNTYVTGYEHILQTVRSALPGLHLTLIQPSPFDDTTRKPGWDPGYNALLVRYGDAVKELAGKQGQAVADLNGPVVAMLVKANETDPAQAQKIIPDRVHPGPGGHLIMAEALLRAWNAPATVAAVEIDAAGKRVANASNTVVRDLTAASSLTWTQTDNALPMPINMADPVIALAIRSSDFVETLDQEPLKVTGLMAAKYTLKIDGQEVGTFTQEQLAGGVNLALLPTPMAKQAAEVHQLTLQHNSIHFVRWRQVEVPLQGQSLPHIRNATGGLDALEADVVAAQRAAALPKPHHYELTPQ